MTNRRNDRKKLIALAALAMFFWGIGKNHTNLAENSLDIVQEIAAVANTPASDEIEEIDDREDLINRLIEYQKYKEITMNIYTTETDAYYHLIIPSENKERDCSYDIIIKFKQTEKNDKFDQSYRQYQIEFFSNCPSFTYGYAYVANINGYLIKELADRYEPAVLKYPPVSKNPGLTFGYEKSIYFACKYIMADKKVLLK